MIKKYNFLFIFVLYIKEMWFISQEKCLPFVLSKMINEQSRARVCHYLMTHCVVLLPSALNIFVIFIHGYTFFIKLNRLTVSVLNRFAVHNSWI